MTSYFYPFACVFHMIQQKNHSKFTHNLCVITCELERGIVYFVSVCTNFMRHYCKLVELPILSVIRGFLSEVSRNR